MPTQRIAVRIPRNQTDPDAQAFITAAGITDTTQQSAINTLVTNLKTYGIWTKMKALYPMVGGTSTTHKFNLKDPRDLDAAFRLQFNGGWTHSANGALPNGTNGYANTFLAPSTSLGLNSTHISGYLRTNLQFSGPIISTEDAGTYNNGLYIWPRQSSNLYSVRINDNGLSGVDSAPADIRGLHIATRTASNVKKYRLNNTQLFNTTETSTGLNTSSIYLGASRNNANYNGNQCAFASIGDGLTDTEAANFYTAVQAFQTTLGRSIGTQTVSDADAQAFINAAVIDDQVQATAINNLVVGLKVDSIWTKMKALYPMVGGTSTAHKFNLKDPRDLDVAFRLQFNGGWTHSANGALPNGTNGYADTYLTPSTSLGINSTHLSYYSRTNVSGVAQHDMGTFGGGSQQTYLMFNYNTQRYVALNNSGFLTPLLSNTTGLLIENRRNLSQIQSYKSGTLVNTASVSSVVLPTTKIYLGVTNGLGPYSTKQCAFASIGDGLTDTEAANFYTRVQAFQVALGREIIPNQTLNLDAGKISSYPGTGTIWTDLSNNSRIGTLTNGVGYSTLNNGSLTFNGSNQYVSVTNLGPVLNNVNKFTLNTWFKLNNPSLNNTIFSFGNNGYYNDDILLAVYGSTIFAQVNTGGDGSAYLVAPFTSTAWTNCQIVFDGTQTGNANRLKMYINGVLQTLTYSYTVPATTSNLNFTDAGIGAYSTSAFNSNFLNGNVSVTELYNSALDQTQVTQNFNNIKSRYGL